MKKLIACFLACSLIGTAFTAFAAETTSVSISEAKESPDHSITVKGVVTDANAKQDITVMATGVIKESGSDVEKYDPDTILFIDQQSDVVSTEGNFEIKFNLSEQAQASSRYMIRIGGTDVETPAFMVIDYSGEGGKPIILYGDVDGNGIVDYADASLLLQYVLNPDDPEVKKAITEKGLELGAVSGQKDLTALDSSMIAKKADNGSFKFPVEK